MGRAMQRRHLGQLVISSLAILLVPDVAGAAPFVLVRGDGVDANRIAAYDLATLDLVTEFAAPSGCVFTHHDVDPNDPVMVTTMRCGSGPSARTDAHLWNTFDGTSTLLRSGTSTAVSLDPDNGRIFIDGEAGTGWYLHNGMLRSASPDDPMVRRPAMNRYGSLFWPTVDASTYFTELKFYDDALRTTSTLAAFQHSRPAPGHAYVSPSDRYVYFGRFDLHPTVVGPDVLHRYDLQTGTLDGVDFVRDPGNYQRIEGFDVTADGRTAYVAFLPGSHCDDTEIHRIDLLTMTDLETTIPQVGCIDHFAVASNRDFVVARYQGHLTVVQEPQVAIDIATDVEYIAAIELTDDLGCFSADDDDCDGVENPNDNCPFDYNPDQDDLDVDGIGDVCDDDDDDDTIPDAVDNCPEIPNKLQMDQDGDHSGDACDVCPSVYNPFQGPVVDLDFGFCVDERLLFDARFAGLAETLVYDWGIDGPWNDALGCPGDCDPLAESWLVEGREAANWYLEQHWDGDGFTYEDALAVMTTDSGIAESTAHDELGRLEGWK
jgi:hypothetical protein